MSTPFGLLHTTGGALATENRVKLAYTWPKGQWGEVRNALVETGWGYYDHASGVFMSPFVNKDCPIKSGSCREGVIMTAWEVPERVDCPAEVPIGKRKIIFHFTTKGKSPSRMEIPSMGFTAYDWKPCKLDLKCFTGEKHYCNGHGLIVAAENCDPIANKRTNTSDFHAETSVSNYKINTLEGLINDRVTLLENQVNRAFCELQNYQAVISKLLAPVFPTAIYQSLGSGSYAFSTGDYMSSMMCTNRTAFIELALRYEGRFLSRPLVRWEEEGEKQVFGQIWPDGSAREGIYFFEKFRLNSDYVFRVNGQPYRYINYTLAPEPPRVINMHPEIKRVHVNLAPMDFTNQESLSAYEKNLAFGYLAAMMSAISSTQEVSRELRGLINENTNDGQTEKFDVGTITSAMGNIVLTFLSGLGSAFVQIILVVLLLNAMLVCFVISFIKFLWLVREFSSGRLLEAATRKKGEFKTRFGRKKSNKYEEPSAPKSIDGMSAQYKDGEVVLLKQGDILWASPELEILNGTHARVWRALSAGQTQPALDVPHVSTIVTAIILESRNVMPEPCTS